MASEQTGTTFTRRGSWGLAALAALVGGIIAISLFGSPNYRIGPLTVRVNVQPSLAGRTVVDLPPMGSIIARTHSAPMTVHARVDNASFEELRSLAIELPKKRAFVAELQKEIRSAMIDFFVRILALAFAGGALSVLIVLGRRRIRTAVLGGLLNTGLLIAVFAATGATYDLQALKDHPTYTGGLRGAPWVIRLLSRGVVRLGDVDSGVQSATDAVYKLYNAIGNIDQGEQPEHDARILVISDIHNNTIGVSFAASIAKQFDVDMILNAGDLTDFGTHFETNLAEQVGKLPPPHVFVTGNHDSPEIVAALRRLRNTIIPGGKTVSVAGIRVFAYNDPASHYSGVRDLVAAPADTTRALADINTQLAKPEDRPDIILVHADYLAKPLFGKAPLVVHGHTHRVMAERVGKSIVVNAGSTGASGIRYFDSRMPKAMSAIIVYVSRKPAFRVAGADIIQLTSPDGEFVITRRLFH